MNHFLLVSITWIERVNEYLGRGIAWAALLMVLITFAVAALRYVFDMGWIALQESAMYLHALIFMLGAAYTFKHDEHVRVDIFYRQFSAKGRAWVNLLGSLLLLIPVAVFILFISSNYVTQSWLRLEGSREAGGLPLVFILKTFIPLFAILLISQALALMARSYLIIQGVLSETTEQHPAGEGV